MYTLCEPVHTLVHMTTPRILSGKALLLASLLVSLASQPASGADFFTSAAKDKTCAGTRFGSALTCSAAEFTVNPVFSAQDGSAPFCQIGTSFDIIVEVELSGSNTDRQDIGFFVGQSGNDPAAVGGQCSVATFPTSSNPPTTPDAWTDNDGDTCGDYIGGASSVTEVDEIRVDCQASANGYLQIPYVLTYWQNNGNVCQAETDLVSSVVPGSKSKCNKGSAEVSGAIAVNAGAWVDITKATNPSGQAQAFTYTATITSTTDPDPKVIALVDGTYYPATIAAASGTTTFTLTDGQSARVFIKALPGSQTLTITEQSETGWDTTAAINCSATNGSPALTTNNSTRTITADLNQTDYSASCNITNTKLASITLSKTSTGDTGTFTFTGTNSWVSQDITTTTAGSPATGTTQYLPYSVETVITETANADWRLDNINCSGWDPNGSATNDISTRSVTFTDSAMPPGTDITCTFSNVRQRDLTVVKNLAPTTDAGTFTLDANGNTASGGHNTTVSAIVDVGSSVSFSETANPGTDFVNYDSSYECYDSVPALVDSDSTTSGSFAMPNDDVTCTFTNTRYSASLTLNKTWVTAQAGDTATVSSSGFINDTSTGASVSTGNNTTASPTVTVYSGESATISESFSVGSPADYTKVLSCTAGSLDTNTGTLTITPGDTVIECTYTNTGAPQLSVSKTVEVVDDGISASNDKSIPGAHMRYTIVLENASSFAGADAVVIRDAIPANTSYQPGSIEVDGVPQGDNTGDGDQTDYNVSTPGVITINKGSFGPSTSTTITFEVIVD
ncbi:MAG: hypothetical protein EP312_03765 [Gammaproteobacteria bacterium]|nr:MAG: hypothetical protein EP312_03765 [Gammaproteobacteria bacterium]